MLHDAKSTIRPLPYGIGPIPVGDPRLRVIPSLSRSLNRLPCVYSVQSINTPENRFPSVPLVVGGWSP